MPGTDVRIDGGQKRGTKKARRSGQGAGREGSEADVFVVARSSECFGRRFLFALQREESTFAFDGGEGGGNGRLGFLDVVDDGLADLPGLRLEGAKEGFPFAEHSGLGEFAELGRGGRGILRAGGCTFDGESEDVGGGEGDRGLLAIGTHSPDAKAERMRSTASSASSNVSADPSELRMRVKTPNSTAWIPISVRDE